MINQDRLLRQNIRAAHLKWGKNLTWVTRQVLKTYTEEFQLSIARGDLLFLDTTWYVTNSGLMRLAQHRRCAGIHVRPSLEFSDPTASRWAFKATVFKTPKCKGFVGFGDADPSNVSALVRGAEMRVAETRAVNRALRKAYGIGICSLEELGSRFESPESTTSAKKLPSQSVHRNGWKAEPKLRDRLCQLIHQHQLDPILVKSYAVDFCGTKTLKDASRDQVEKFVNHLADWAAKDKNAALPAQQLPSAAASGCSMKRRFPGLHQTVESDSVADGVYLVRVEQVQYRWNAHKPFYAVRFQVLEPTLFAGRSIQARLYCTHKALWKLSWFVHDFGYDSELLDRDELDEKALVGLTGVVQVSHVVVHGIPLINLEAFAPAEQWSQSNNQSTISSDSEVAS